MDYRGYSPEKRKDLRKGKIVGALIEGAKTFTQLYNELGKKTSKSESGWSRTDFTLYLKELKEELIVGNMNQKYVLIEKHFGKEDYDLLKKLHSINREREDKVSELLKEIYERDESRKVTLMKINDLILRELITFLEGVEGTVRAPQKFGYYARWLLSQNTDIFQRILVACGKRDEEATDFCLWKIKDSLRFEMESSNSRAQT